MKNVATFIKTRFYRKRGRFYRKRSCIKMCKHAETFHANYGGKFAIVIFIPVSPFQNRNLGCTFQTLFARKVGLAHPYFWDYSRAFIWPLWPTRLFIWLEKNGNVFSLWDPFLPTGPLFRESVFSQVQGLDPGPVFR